MSKPLVPDELWEIVAPLLPAEPPKPKGGRPRVPDRRVTLLTYTYLARPEGAQPCMTTCFSMSLPQFYW